ncbi:hypothetical protein PIB30_009475 [Stylosanthes scabra]|uniref:Uncharacterized protein n=1 Tax=Stylosanthes scabra TaxID=79078 RepID=A0ABU6Y3I4_9FABA|nr:hypothetical protein [Stylosanthes scabra]
MGRGRSSEIACTSRTKAEAFGLGFADHHLPQPPTAECRVLKNIPNPFFCLLLSHFFLFCSQIKLTSGSSYG